MADLSPTTFNLTIAAFGLLLYLFAWRVTRDLPPAAKVFSRLSLAVIALVPVILGIFFGATTPKYERVGGSAPPAGSSAPQSTAEAPRSAPPVVPAPPITPAPMTRSQSSTPETAAKPEAARKSEPAAPGSTPPADTGATRGMPAPVAGGAPAPATADYDVVPVFYGTDRGAKPGEKRVSYDSDRAKRLELGRAMVTVPKAHEVPNIERPWAYRIPLTNVVIYQEAEDPKKHFTLQEVKALSKEDYLKLIRERLATSSRFKDHAVVFIHGFNTTFDFAIFRAAQMAYDLKFDGAPFVYSWPSKGQLGLQDYGYDRGSAEQAEPYLKEFLTLVTRETGPRRSVLSPTAWAISCFYRFCAI